MCACLIIFIYNIRSVYNFSALFTINGKYGQEICAEAKWIRRCLTYNSKQCFPSACFLLFNLLPDQLRFNCELALAKLFVYCWLEVSTVQYAGLLSGSNWWLVADAVTRSAPKQWLSRGARTRRVTYLDKPDIEALQDSWGRGTVQGAPPQSGHRSPPPNCIYFSICS